MSIEKISYLGTIFSLFFACTIVHGSGLRLALEEEAKATASMQAGSVTNPLRDAALPGISSVESLYSGDGDQTVPRGVKFIDDGVQVTSVSPIGSLATYVDSRRPLSTSDFFGIKPTVPLRRHIESQTTGPNGEPCCSCSILCCVFSCFNPCGE